MDEAGTAAGWPRGRYLFVETRSPGEPDLEVEFVFESYAEMERLERRLREYLARAARDVAGPGQETLLEPSATRYLQLLDDSQTRSGPVPAGAAGQATAPMSGLTAAPEPQEPRPAPPPAATEPVLTVAQQRARQLAAARAAMENAERTAGMPADKRASGRRPEPGPSPDSPEEEEEDDEALGASA